MSATPGYLKLEDGSRFPRPALESDEHHSPAPDPRIGRTGSMSEDELFLQRRTIHYVEFGGIGGDIAAITITTEAWRDLGSPETVKVTVAPEPGEQEP